MWHGKFNCFYFFFFFHSQGFWYKYKTSFIWFFKRSRENSFTRIYNRAQSVSVFFKFFSIDGTTIRHNAGIIRVSEKKKKNTPCTAKQTKVPIYREEQISLEIWKKIPINTDHCHAVTITYRRSVRKRIWIRLIIFCSFETISGFFFFTSLPKSLLESPPVRVTPDRGYRIVVRCFLFGRYFVVFFFFFTRYRYIFFF